MNVGNFKRPHIEIMHSSAILEMLSKYCNEVEYVYSFLRLKFIIKFLFLIYYVFVLITVDGVAAI